MPLFPTEYEQAEQQGLLWTPELDRPDLWFDSRDSPSMSTWVDKWGRLSLALTNTGGTPTLGSIGTLPARVFIKNSFYSASYNARSLAGLTVFALATRSGNSSNAVASIIDSGDPANDVLLSTDSAGSVTLWQVNSGGDGGLGTSGANPISGLATGVFNGSLSGNARWALRLNGAPAATTSSGTAPATTSATMGLTLRIGEYFPGWAWGWEGPISQVLLYRRALSVYEAQRLEAWAWWACGRAVPMDAGNPFFNRPPLVFDA